jgi:hypothetical protein
MLGKFQMPNNDIIFSLPSKEVDLEPVRMQVLRGVEQYVE